MTTESKDKIYCVICKDLKKIECLRCRYDPNITIPFYNIQKQYKLSHIVIYKMRVKYEGMRLINDAENIAIKKYKNTTINKNKKIVEKILEDRRNRLAHMEKCTLIRKELVELINKTHPDINYKIGAYDFNQLVEIAKCSEDVFTCTNIIYLKLLPNINKMWIQKKKIIN